MEQMRSFWQRFVQIMTFINLPIRKKFLLFETGTFFWFFLIGIVAVSSLSFIHYRYLQITQSTLPYMKAVYSIAPELSSLEQTLNAANDENPSLLVKASLTHMKKALSDTVASVHQQAINGNIFEMLLQSLSKSDRTNMDMVESILQEVTAMEEIANGMQKSKNSAEWAVSKESLSAHVAQAHNLTHLLLEKTETIYEDYSVQVASTIRFSINTIATVILIAVVLLAFFTHWLKNAFSRPLESMIQQIRLIGRGEVDLNKKLSIKSQDEIGMLSAEFNKLVDTVYGVTVFKKVIEEDSSLEIVYSRLGEVFEKEAGISEYRIFDVNAAKQTMNVVYPHIIDDKEFLNCNEEILHNCTLCRAQKTGHAVSSFEYEGVCKEFMKEEGKKHVCIPLIVAGHAGAVVQFLFDENENDAIHEKLFKAESYIKHSLSVIETKRLMNTLRESSLVDGLTGLYNRRFLQDHSNQLIAGTLRRKKQISLLMCDMDYFKQVNDKYGHDVGDNVLKETSLILKKSVREADIVVRFGGEEFLILLTDTEAGYGMKVAEKIRESVENYNFKTTDGILKKTICIGICDFPHDTEGFWQAIKFADVALYKAKESGRNRCIQFSAELWDQKASF